MECGDPNAFADRDGVLTDDLSDEAASSVTAKPVGPWAHFLADQQEAADQDRVIDPVW